MNIISKVRRDLHACAIFVRPPIGNESVPKIIADNTIYLCFKTAVSILLISNRNSFRVLFDKIASVYLT